MQDICEKAKAAGVTLIDVTAVPRITIACLSKIASWVDNHESTCKQTNTLNRKRRCWVICPFLEGPTLQLSEAEAGRA